MQLLTKKFNSFEKAISLIGHSLMTILGVIFIAGVLNPIYIPKTAEFEIVNGELLAVAEGEYVISIRLQSTHDMNFKYLKKAGNWQQLYVDLKSLIGNTLELTCSRQKIHFAIPTNDNSCFIFEIKSKNKVIRSMVDTSQVLNKTNFYFLLFGALLTIYGAVRTYFLSKNKSNSK